MAHRRFLLFTVKIRKANKFVLWFLGESTARKSAFGFIWPLFNCRVQLLSCSKLCKKNLVPNLSESMRRPNTLLTPALYIFPSYTGFKKIFTLNQIITLLIGYWVFESVDNASRKWNNLLFSELTTAEILVECQSRATCFSIIEFYFDEAQNFVKPSQFKSQRVFSSSYLPCSKK